MSMAGGMYRTVRSTSITQDLLRTSTVGGM